MANLLWCVLVVLGLPYLLDGAKILNIFPFPGRSHNILGEGFNKLLLKAGHEVSYITPFPAKNPPPKMHYIDVSSNMEHFPEHQTNLERILNKDVKVNDFKVFFSILSNMSNATLSHENVQKMLNDPKQTFDVIIIEWMFSEVYAGLSSLYDCPYIWFSTVDPHTMVLSLIDEILNPAYNPGSISTNVPPFNFIQRVQELIFQIMMKIFKIFYSDRIDNSLYNEIIGPLMAKRGKALPDYSEVLYNASLMLGNSHISFGRATRLPQNYKPIGGYHIDPEVQPLSDELEKIMKSAEHGVIYFSMGSNLKSKDFPEEIKRDLLKMFGGLKYTVIWKFEEQLSNIPKNVHILKWAPQPSILAHRKCKLFITHGGLLSTTETVYFGIPIIGIPVIADQYVNVELAVKKGYALKVDLAYEMADKLNVAIEEILGNTKYTDTVKTLSSIFHDRLVPPGVEFVHWVEHVIKTNGAPHLRSPALMVPWYQKLYLDFLALVVAIIYVLVKAIKLMFCSKNTAISTKASNSKATSSKKKKN